MRLTKRAIDQLKPPEKEEIHFDESLSGFGLRCRPSGSKAFLIQYRDASGRTRKYTLGRYGHLTPTQARQLARDHLARIAQGANPAEERKQGREGLTVSELAEVYMERHARPKKKPSSIQSDERLLRLVIIPSLGRLKVAAVTRGDVAKMHDKHRGTPTQANRAASLAGKMFALAERWGYRADGSNPARNIDRYKEEPRKRYLTGEETSRLAEALKEAEGSNSEHPSAILCIRLLLLTGARRGEILGLRWDEVDLPGNRLRLQDSKTGAKDIQLNAPTLELLTNAARVDGNPFVCWGNTPEGPFIGIDKSWRRIRSAAELEDVRLHDLRHSYAAAAVGAGMSLPVIGGLLGHKTPATTKRYAHLESDVLQRAASQIGAEVAARMRGTEAEIVPFEKEASRKRSHG
ncbi:MAG: tyrosine-type recombinase/integrase [Acidobacteriota bacterium]